MKEFKSMVDELKEINKQVDDGVDDDNVSETDFDRLCDRLFVLQDKVIEFLVEKVCIDHETAQKMVCMSAYRERLYAIADRI